MNEPKAEKSKAALVKPLLRRLSKNLLALGIGVLAAFVLGELLARWWDLPPEFLAALDSGQYRVADNPILGFEYRPDQTGADENYAGRTHAFTTNSEGFRDYEYEVDRPLDVFRIVNIGDSVSAGSGVAFEETYAKVLERTLTLPGKRIEVLNLGVGGYNTLQEAETLRLNGIKYDPNVVLVQFCVNDFYWERTRLGNAGRTGAHERERQAALNRRPRSPLMQRVVQHSRLLRFFYFQARSLSAKGFHYDLARYERDRRKAIEENTNPVEAGIKLIDRMRREGDFKVYILLIPAFDRPFSEYRFNHVHARLMAIASKYPAIEIIDFLPKLRAITDDASTFAFDPVHLNAYGHKVLAAQIANVLQEDS